MGFRIQKRVKLGKGLGLNISKKGVSASFRNNGGSFGATTASLRTGIPGLTYRSSNPLIKTIIGVSLLFSNLNNNKTDKKVEQDLKKLDEIELQAENWAVIFSELGLEFQFEEINKSIKSVSENIRDNINKGLDYRNEFSSLLEIYNSLNKSLESYKNEM